MNVYKKLQELLDVHPSGAPESEYFDEILKILFTEEEAKLALHMSFNPMKLEKMAESASISVADAERMLENMADKVIIFSNDKNDVKTYGLLPTIPGLFEFPFMKGGGEPMHKELGLLWEKYHHEGLGESFCGNPTPLMRVVPVEKSLDVKSKIHTYEEVANLIKNSKYLALAECACRVSVGKCSKPKDVCLIFDTPGRFLVERGYAKQISKDEGLTVLDRSEEAGLVHTSNNTMEKANLICNCCSCCCTILRGRTELNHPHAFAPSRWYAEVNNDECSGCMTCINDRCPVEAIEMKDEVASVSPEICIGCGLCVSGCPDKAVVLMERENVPEISHNIQELGVKILQEKNKFEKFLEIMKK